MKKKDLNFTSPIIINDKEYEVKTFVDKKGNLKSQLKNKKKILGEKKVKINKKTKDKEIVTYVEKFHEKFIHELSTLNKLNEQEEEKKNLKLLIFLGSVFYTKGLIKESKQIFKKVLRRKDNSVEALNYLGVIYMKEGNYPQAIDYLKQATTLAPDLVEPELRLIEAYLKLDSSKSMKKVEKELDRILENHPNYHYTYWYLSLFNLKKLINEDYKENEDLDIISNTLNYLKKAHELASKYIDTDVFEDTYVQVNRGDFKKAFDNVQYIIDNCKESLYHTDIDNFHLTLLKYKNNKDKTILKEAITKFSELIKINPNKALRNKIGILYFLLGQEYLEKAQENFEKALEEDEQFNFAKTNYNMTRNCTRNIDYLLFDFLKQ
ncbi:MAG TPA: tetratricopeptide repeat protein [Candidatus Mcinerneyibacterium sp.]|nr:tetratricopeptide repeat protein [Candidatus Mcinerneyibacterium sp.]